MRFHVDRKHVTPCVSYIISRRYVRIPLIPNTYSRIKKYSSIKIGESFDHMTEKKRKKGKTRDELDGLFNFPS